MAGIYGSRMMTDTRSLDPMMMNRKMMHASRETGGLGRTNFLFPSIR